MLEAMLEATDEGVFVGLPGETDTLKDVLPNHLFIHPRYFTRFDGPKSIGAKTLAMETIKYLNNEEEASETEEEKRGLRREMRNVEALLAFLWAAKQGLLTQVHLTEMPESPHPNHQCELVMSKIRKTIPSETSTTSDAADGLAVATHSFMLAMNSNEATRIKEREEDKHEKLLIRNMSPRQ
jgi:hypothetical protein